MVKKKLKGKRCYVTFEVNIKDAQKVSVVGDWNGWKPEPMKKRGNVFVLKKIFGVGEEHRFRYLINDSLWENDPSADDYVPNPFGSHDCVIRT